jgi:phosphatidate cytidylyltransferase
MKDLLKRLFFSFCLIGLIALLLTFAYVPFFSFIVAISISLFAMIATYEFMSICKVKVNQPKALLIIFSPLIVLSFFLSAVNEQFSSFPLVLIFLAIIAIFIHHFNSIKDSIAEISIAVFSFLYISVPLGMLVYILYSPLSSDIEDGRIWIVIILALSKISDIFGYFIGKIFGRNKLIEKVSPNKTIEGSIAGVVATLILSIIIQYYFPMAFGNYIMAVLIGLITVILSQIGDLGESLMKRDAKIKDSNKIPGIGGILDSLDSLLFTIPFYYIWLG